MGDEKLYLKSKPSQPKEEIGQSSGRMWDVLVRESPLNRLRYLDAVLARGGDVDKDRVAELIREAGPKACLSDPDAVGLIRQLFGERGVERLKHRANSTVKQNQG
jgi:hypothetical protein